MKTGQQENQCDPSTSKAAEQNRKRGGLEFFKGLWKRPGSSKPGRWWNSATLGQAICDDDPFTMWYIEAPAKISRRSEVMAGIRRRRDLKAMRKERRGR